MSVETTDRKQSYAGGQGTLTYSFRSLVDYPEYIKVVVVSSGTETALTYGVDYSVTPSADGIGGVVVVSPSYSTAYTYTIYRETGNVQTTDYDDYNQFPANTLETDLDRAILLAQELSEDIGRALKISISSTLSSLALPDPSEGRSLIWSGITIVNSAYNADSIGTIALNAATTASTAAAAAAASETNAGNYASTASTQATLAGNYATTASTAATTASTQAALAGNYATTASTAATLAGNYATTASTAATTASTQAALAGNYATTASTQATLAGNYATTASTAAVDAANYATTASTEAAAAVISAATASTQATLAGNYATTASTAATTASTQATLAGNYATTASTEATLAGNYATTASTEAALAGNYASTASTQATLAGLYASTASTQATTASTQAALAGNYATTASTQATLAGNYATTCQTIALALPTANIQYVIDGGGETITTGIKGDLEIPFNCTIATCTLLANTTGSIVIDIWKDVYANFPPTDADSITASAVPSIATATNSQDGTLTGWTTSIVSGSTLRFNVDSVTALQRVTLSLKVIRS